MSEVPFWDESFRNYEEGVIPFLEFSYEKWRLLMNHEGDIDLKLAYNEDLDEAGLFVCRDGNVIARIINPDDTHHWVPAYKRSADIMKAFREAAEDDWRRTSDDFEEDHKPSADVLLKYMKSILKDGGAS